LKPRERERERREREKTYTVLYILICMQNSAWSLIKRKEEPHINSINSTIRINMDTLISYLYFEIKIEEIKKVTIYL
jgi:hypothetical protein